MIFIPNTAVFGPTNFIETTTIASTARMKISDEDFGWRFRMRMKISAEDFYGGRTGPLEKFYLFILFFKFF